MPKKISEETIQLMEELYAQDLPVAEIARRTNVSYSTAHGYTKLRQRVNPETGKPFKSLSQLMDYQARQRLNPETGKPFESRSQLRDYQARQRQERPENQGLSNLIRTRLKELGKNQSWLAKKMGITRQAVSLYVKGRRVPSDDSLKKLYSSLDVPYTTLDDLLG